MAGRSQPAWRGVQPMVFSAARAFGLVVLLAWVPGAVAQEVEHGKTPLVLQWESADWGPPTNRPGFPAGLRNPLPISPRTRRPAARPTSRDSLPGPSSRRTGTATPRRWSCSTGRWTSSWTAPATRRTPAPTSRRSCCIPAGESEFAPHWHSYTETVVVLDGALDIVMDGTRYTANAAPTSSSRPGRTMRGTPTRTRMRCSSHVATARPTSTSSIPRIPW